ncbi:MAG TPA: nicotinate-nucleotide--dimethylbenzimidazole phosphoribosyltransferase [Candidatus Sumerlaeota bacterium]|nr:nicotinate-nucleotide--dimethylbenzimidazole phosphoribosyltransferase [Candidatus Sumerlaeota bacterium]
MSNLLEQTLQSIDTPNAAVEEAARERLRQQARPAGSLGMLETLSARLAGIAGTLNVHLNQKVIVTCAGDHGVVAEGVSRFPQEVTKLMVLNFVNDGASINVLARHAGARVCVADLGVNCDFSPDLPIFHKKVAHGTGNLAVEPAMTREQAIRSLEAGIEIVEELLQQGPLDILGTGDMGIANTTPSSAIIAAFSGLEASEVTGRGTGIDDSALQNKIRVINQALKHHQPNPDDALDVLAKVGGLEIGGLAGLVLGAAAHGIPVVCDGLISTAGALVACKLAPRAKAYLFASHRSVEVGHRFMHQQLNLEPILDFGMRLGEGTGAALAMEILDASTRVLADIKTFDEVAIADAQK